MMENYSVIIPVHNGANYISQALESILAQSYLPAEIVLVNDHCEDDTVAIAQSTFPGIEILHATLRGQSAALNVGVAAASSDYITFLDHDDLWPREKSELQYEILKRNPEYSAVYSQVVNFSGEIKDAGPSINMGSARVLAAAFFRKSTFDLVGPFDETIPHHAIVEWWLRSDRTGIKVLEDDHVGLFRRIHESNSGVTHKVEARSTLFSILRNEIHRDPTGGTNG
ncbi:MAG: glycosyltransferase family A protein [Actinomycetes bacterium]